MWVGVLAALIWSHWSVALSMFKDWQADPNYSVGQLVPLGYMAPMIPEQYGGSYVDVMTYGVICEELARVDWVIASVVSVTNSLCATAIPRFETVVVFPSSFPGLVTTKARACPLAVA